MCQLFGETNNPIEACIKIAPVPFQLPTKHAGVARLHNALGPKNSMAFINYDINLVFNCKIKIYFSKWGVFKSRKANFITRKMYQISKV